MRLGSFQVPKVRDGDASPEVNLPPRQPLSASSPPDRPSVTPAESRCCRPLGGVVIFPRMAALTCTGTRGGFQGLSGGRGGAYHFVLSDQDVTEVMSVSPCCLLNLRRHYFATQHDCIHITPQQGRRHAALRATLRRGPLEGAGFNREDGDPSASSSEL